MKQSLCSGATKSGCNGRYPRAKRLLPTTLALWILPLILVACQTTDFVATDLSCDVFRPISWSKDDTFRTSQQILEHNAAWRSICSAVTKVD